MEIGDTAHPIGADHAEDAGRVHLDGPAADSAAAYAQEELGLYACADGSPLAAAALGGFVAVDAASQRLLEEVARIATTASTVLVRGEPGAGKQALALLMHYLGPRPHEPLLTLNCAGRPREILESELFGHERGAFGGVLPAKRGCLELAGAGTLVLNEVAALPMPAQARLLRAIDQKRCERLGSAQRIPVSARIVALTSVDLEHAVARRTFREDLYYRLNVVPVVVPPLRERPADIRVLAEVFLARTSEVHRKPHLSFDTAALTALEAYAFPGNVAELRGVVEQAVQGAKGPHITVADLPAHIRSAATVNAPDLSLEELERRHIAAVLEHTRGKKTMAAGILGISRKTLLEKRKRYRLG